MSEQPELDIDEQLEKLGDKETEFSRLCQFASANRLAGEIRRLARAERRFTPYLQATFTIMNNAADRLDPQAGRDAAIEIIGLLESNDLARAIQPDLSDQEYDQAVHWYSACGYDNLAKATAEIGGYNSDGIHACISEGIEVCRRTGKTQCITCFREYATEVYRAADDPDLALHYARMGIAGVNRGPHDRRWAGARDLMEILLARGELGAAAESVDAVIEFAEIWHSPIRARLNTKPRITEIAHLLGEPHRWQDQCQQEAPQTGEFLAYELHSDHTQATIECLAGDFDAAIKRLTRWDQQLTRRQCFEQWSKTRLRLLAAHRMAGHQREFERLADQLQNKSLAARDWHALRCLKHLRDESAIPVPIPLTHNFDVGPLAATTTQTASTTSAATNSTGTCSNTTLENSAEETSAATAQADEEIPAVIKSVHSRLGLLSADNPSTGEDQDSIDKIITDLLAINPEDVGPEKTQRTYRHWALHTISHLIRDADRVEEIWDWAGGLLSAQRQDAVTLSLYARLGCILRYKYAEQMSDKIDEKQLESWFRESLDLDSERANNFGRAGDFFLFQENLGEAERCYARGCRLDRSHAELASKLARIYRRTERERDALAVLDMAIRAGAGDSDLLWEAAMSAQSLDQYESTLAYLGAFQNAVPDRPWVNYYRAVALLELQRYPEAHAAAEREAELNPDCPFPGMVQRAAVAAGTGQLAELKQLVSEIVSIPLSSIDYLNLRGLERVLAMLWKATESLPENDPLRTQVSDRLVASNLAPDQLFEMHRVKGDPVENVNFYRCMVEQPLDDRWLNWHGRLAGEEELKSYQATWGVLARSDAEAAKCVLEWQSKCYPLDAQVVDVELVGEGYTEHIGVVWQRIREGT
jgi:tetratricopeptide (TPR) repeat protein